MSFANLKRNSSNLEKLTKAVEALNQNQYDSSDNDKYWKPEVDKVGNGFAIIRFLPPSAIDGEDGLPWVKLFNHGFQGPTGSWYIENSLTTFNEPDPVSEYNSELWNTGIEANKEIARKQKRKLTYVSNIYIVDDPKHPENNGKVFLFKYGKKIFEKITAAMNPEFQDETPLNPFDLWGGADFKLKIRKADGYQNYDKSEFDKPRQLLDDDKALEAIWKKEYSLNEILDRKNFKSYEQLKTRMNRVLGLTVATVGSTKSAKSVQDQEEAMEKSLGLGNTSAPDTDDDLQYFAQLADEN